MPRTRMGDTPAWLQRPQVDLQGAWPPSVAADACHFVAGWCSWLVWQGKRPPPHAAHPMGRNAEGLEPAC